MLGSADETGSGLHLLFSFTVSAEHCWVSIAELRIQKRGHDSREITIQVCGSVGLSQPGKHLGGCHRRRRGSEGEERLLGAEHREQHVRVSGSPGVLSVTSNQHHLNC